MLFSSALLLWTSTLAMSQSRVVPFSDWFTQRSITRARPEFHAILAETRHRHSSVFGNGVTYFSARCSGFLITTSPDQFFIVKGCLRFPTNDVNLRKQVHGCQNVSFECKLVLGFQDTTQPEMSAMNVFHNWAEINTTALSQ